MNYADGLYDGLDDAYGVSTYVPPSPPVFSDTDEVVELTDEQQALLEQWEAKQTAKEAKPVKPDVKPLDVESGNGLQFAKRWVLALVGCDTRAVTWSVKATGSAIREYVHIANGTVYVGLDALSADTGIPKGTLSERRKVLIDTGWLTPTGEIKGRGTKVYRLTIPS